MQWFNTPNPDTGIVALSKEIISALQKRRKVLWLICGGSNIPPAVEIMDAVRRNVGESLIGNLIVGQTDERYGPLGHKDSNWQQMTEKGFKMDKITVVPVLTGKTLRATVTDYAKRITPVMDETIKSKGLIIALFGIGTNSHIAGIMPQSRAFTDPGYVSGYKSEPFTRVTLTPRAIRKIDSAYLFAFGESKREVMAKLKNGSGSIEDEPAQIIKEMPAAYIYTDQ